MVHAKNRDLAKKVQVNELIFVEIKFKKKKNVFLYLDRILTNLTARFVRMTSIIRTHEIFIYTHISQIVRRDALVRRFDFPGASHKSKLSAVLFKGQQQ